MVDKPSPQTKEQIAEELADMRDQFVKVEVARLLRWFLEQYDYPMCRAITVALASAVVANGSYESQAEADKDVEHAVKVIRGGCDAIFKTKIALQGSLL